MWAGGSITHQTLPAQDVNHTGTPLPVRLYWLTPQNRVRVRSGKEEDDASLEGVVLVEYAVR